MKCHLCPNYIVIRTDPENRDYKIVSGASKKTETYSAEDAETIAIVAKEEGDYDPLKKLEKSHIDEVKAKV